MLDSKTFGNFPASIVLVNMINENEDYKNKKLLSQISKCTTHFNTVLNELEKVDINTAIFIVKSIHPKYIEIALSLPEKYGTYTANVVESIKKQWMKDKNINLPKNKRNKITKK